jgi:hypothetical protein
VFESGGREAWGCESCEIDNDLALLGRALGRHVIWHVVLVGDNICLLVMYDVTCWEISQ